MIETVLDDRTNQEKRKSARETAGLKIETVGKVPGVAHMLNLSVDYIKRIERNGRCCYGTAKRLAYIYKSEIWIFILK